jgi:hypothetical protein
MISHSAHCELLLYFSDRELPGSLYGNAGLPGTQEGLHPNLIAAYVAIHFLKVADA